MTMVLPCRLITRQRSHMGFTDALTFIAPGPRSLARRHEKTRLPPRLTMVANRSHQPAAAFLHDAAVELESAAVPEILDDVPVELAHVRPSDLGQPVSEREVGGAVDLLVEQRVLHVARDAGVAADPELAEVASALVEVERLQQELLVGRGRRLDDAPSLEAKCDSGDLPPVVDGRKLAEDDLAFGRILDRREEELAAWHVGAVPDDPHFLGSVEVLRIPAHALVLGVPIEQARAVQEVLELLEREAGF